MQYQKTNKSTQHGFGTPFGHNTPFRLPTLTEDVAALMNSLVKQLYPTGRVWQMPELKTFESFHRALNTEKVRFINDAKAVIDSTIPDNDNFDEADATLWENRLGLITNTLISIEERRLAILRKLSFPNNIKARQHPTYIENQLRSAGFDVYIHQNVKPYINPSDILAGQSNVVQHGEPTQHGDATQHGSGSFDLIANSIDSNEIYSIGGDENLYATFFIGGPSLTGIATVSELREREFRELVLKLKPAQTVAFLLINFN